MDELNNALADVKVEGENPFADFEKDTQPESLPEKEPEEEEPTGAVIPEEEDVPFHRNPRWIAREAELQELRQREEEMAIEIEEIRSLATKPQQDTNVPEWFKTLYGDNEIAWQQYSEHDAKRTEEIEARVFARQEEERTKKQREEEHWNNWVETELSKIKAQEPSVDENKLLAILQEYKPTDINNNFDFQAGLKIYKALEGAPDTSHSDARKRLADTATVTTPKGEPKKKDYMTPADLRNTSWHNL